MDGPLAGLRILDSTTMNAMPTANFLMADMGAEVIKVENPAASRGQDGGRVFPDNDPGTDPWNRDGGFHALHRSKLSFALNFKVQESIDAFKDLVRISDVVCENN